MLALELKLNIREVRSGEALHWRQCWASFVFAKDGFGAYYQKQHSDRKAMNELSSLKCEVNGLKSSVTGGARVGSETEEKFDEMLALCSQFIFFFSPKKFEQCYKEQDWNLWFHPW